MAESQTTDRPTCAACWFFALGAVSGTCRKSPPHPRVWMAKCFRGRVVWRVQISEIAAASVDGALQR